MVNDINYILELTRCLIYECPLFLVYNFYIIINLYMNFDIKFELKKLF
jgi:hypothetical protein